MLKNVLSFAIFYWFSSSPFESLSASQSDGFNVVGTERAFMATDDLALLCLCRIELLLRWRKEYEKGRGAKK
jgi:hypothetical protein